MGIACVQAHHRISLWNTRQPDVLYNPRPSPEGILPFESILIPLPRQFCHDMESRFIHRHSVTFHLIDSEYQREPIRFKQAICQHALFSYSTPVRLTTLGRHSLKETKLSPFQKQPANRGQQQPTLPPMKNRRYCS